jgi:hypothetical protein
MRPDANARRIDPSQSFTRRSLAPKTLKAELEVRTLNEKLDLPIHQQWAHLLEIQQVQTEMIRDMVARREV